MNYPLLSSVLLRLGCGLFKSSSAITTPHHTAACAAREEKFRAAWAVGLPGFLKAVGLTLLAWQADPQGLVMVIGPMALVALREVSPWLSFS